MVKSKKKEMTKQEKLEEIQQQIRKDISKLMELTYGCIVENNNNKERSIYLGEVRQNEIYKVFKDCNDGEIWIDYENYFWLNDYEDYAFTIIGHEIMLNDVLEWLEDYNFYIDTEGAFYKYDPTYVENSSGMIHITQWDLSKPYLKDQSEKFINFLYELKK